MRPHDQAIIDGLAGVEGPYIEAALWAYCGANRTSPEDCWEWRRGRSKRGYGLFSIGGKSRPAHRVAFYLTTGELPWCVCHTCDNPPCCNPRHLFGGTDADNYADAERKGRRQHKRPRGETHPLAKLTTADVLEARELKSQGVRYRDLAVKYGVGLDTVFRAVKGDSWKHL